MKLDENIYLIGSGANGNYLTNELDCNCYLINFDGVLAMFDSGSGIQPQLIEREIEADGYLVSDISYIFLTHCHADHAGGAGYFRELYGIKVVAPKLEADSFMEGDERALGLEAAKKAGYYPQFYRLSCCKVDETVMSGEVWDNGPIKLSVFEAAGHSSGGVCYLGKAGKKSFLIVGDLISIGGRINLQMIPGSDVQAYSRSVNKLSKLKFDLFLPGHGAFWRRYGSHQVDRAIKVFERLQLVE